MKSCWKFLPVLEWKWRKMRIFVAEITQKPHITRQKRRKFEDTWKSMKNCDTRYNSLRIKGLPPPQTKYQYSLKRLFGCTLCGLFGMDTLLRRHISLCGRAFLCLAFASLMMSCGDDDLPSPEDLKLSSEELVIFCDLQEPGISVTVDTLWDAGYNRDF